MPRLLILWPYQGRKGRFGRLAFDERTQRLFRLSGLTTSTVVELQRSAERASRLTQQRTTDSREPERFDRTRSEKALRTLSMEVIVPKDSRSGSQYLRQRHKVCETHRTGMIKMNKLELARITAAAFG